MQALQGIRIIDFSLVWAGPFAARLLADFGAEVIKLESVQHPDRQRFAYLPKGELGKNPHNRGGYFHQYNRNKLDLTLNLSASSGRDVFLKLVEKSDVFISNHGTRVLENTGLSYKTIHQQNPSLIMLSMPGFGNTGPCMNLPAYGLIIQARGGYSALTGYADGTPFVGAYIADPVSALHATTVLLAALRYRRHTGKGVFIDLSQHECLDRILGTAIMDYNMNRKIAAPQGDKHSYIAPYGVYRCRDEDSWIALSIDSEDNWEKFCRLVGHDEWLADERFANMALRKQNEGELDRLIAGFTAKHDSHELMHSFQKAGLAAGAVSTVRDVLDDAHLKERGFFWDVDCPESGTYRHIGPIIRMSRTPANLRMPPPKLGEHNDYILKEILGLSSEQVAELEKEKVIGQTPEYAQ